MISLEKVASFSYALGDVVKHLRNKYSIRKRELARLACIDPSYPTILEEKGVIPSKNFVARIALAFEEEGATKKEVHNIYWSARIVPPDIPVRLLEKYARMTSLPIEEQNSILNRLESTDSTK